MIDNTFYLVERDVAVRSGLLNSRYRTLDGRYVLDSKDLSRIRLRSDEFENGLSGIERISPEDAKTLIAKGGFKVGDETSKKNK